MRRVAFSSSSLRDLLEERLGVLVAGPEALEVQHAGAAEAADLDGGGRRDDAVHGAGEQGQLEVEALDLPGDVDVLGVAGAPARHDGDVVEPVGPPSGLAQPDLELCHGSMVVTGTAAGRVSCRDQGVPRRPFSIWVATALFISKTAPAPASRTRFTTRSLVTFGQGVEGVDHGRAGGVGDLVAEGGQALHDLALGHRGGRRRGDDAQRVLGQLGRRA